VFEKRALRKVSAAKEEEEATLDLKNTELCAS
jgi:hypothetical protein